MKLPLPRRVSIAVIALAAVVVLLIFFLSLRFASTGSPDSVELACFNESSVTVMIALRRDGTQAYLEAAMQNDSSALNHIPAWLHAQHPGRQGPHRACCIFVLLLLLAPSSTCCRRKPTRPSMPACRSMPSFTPIGAGPAHGWPPVWNIL